MGGKYVRRLFGFEWCVEPAVVFLSSGVTNIVGGPLVEFVRGLLPTRFVCSGPCFSEMFLACLSLLV